MYPGSEVSSQAHRAGFCTTGQVVSLKGFRQSFSAVGIDVIQYIYIWTHFVPNGSSDTSLVVIQFGRSKLVHDKAWMDYDGLSGHLAHSGPPSLGGKCENHIGNVDVVPVFKSVSCDLLGMCVSAPPSKHTKEQVNHI